MIRICKYLYINVLTVIFFCICLAFGNEKLFIISYGSMFLHETAHMAAALCIGLRPARLCLHPFGVNMKLKSNFVYSLSDEIILYISGPFMNLLLSLIFIRSKYSYASSVNLALFFVNLLPVLPLDGGNILKSIITDKAGEYHGMIIMKSISFITGLCIFIFGIYSIYITGYNYSVIFISILIFLSLFSKDDKFSRSGIKSVIQSSPRTPPPDGIKAGIVAIPENSHVSKYAKHFFTGKYTIGAIIDENGHITRLITENDLSYLLKNSSNF